VATSQSHGSGQRLLRELIVTVIVQNFSTHLTIRVINNPPFRFVWNARAANPGFPFEALVLQPETRPFLVHRKLTNFGAICSAGISAGVGFWSGESARGGEEVSLPRPWVCRQWRAFPR